MGSPPPQAQPPVNPQAAAQLTNLAGGVMGAALGNALVAPLPNQYQGHKPVKPVVSDDDGIQTPNAGAASDIINGYTPNQESPYEIRLDHFRELHDAEMDQRRAALKKLKGTSAEKWCAAHIGILFPEPPVVDVTHSYPDKVRAYDREKQRWDERCGGPSQQDGYQSFDDELAALKPDAPPAPAAVPGTTAKAPTYDAPAPSPQADAPAAAQPEKPADSFADAAKELDDSPPAKTAPAADAPPSAQTPPADVGAAPDSAPSPDDSQNTNRATEFFGEKNAKVTAKDLADTRAPDLTDPRSGGQGAGGDVAPSSVAGPAGRRSGSATQAPAAASGTKGAATVPALNVAPAPATIAPSGKASSLKTKSPPAKNETKVGVDAGILDIIKKSHTFYAIYQHLAAQNFHVVYVSKDVGTGVLKRAHVIRVTDDERDDQNAKATSLAHEYGHSRYVNHEPDPATMSEADYVAAYVKDRLADEGEATLTNLQIQKELKENGGPEIEIAGDPDNVKRYRQIAAKYPNLDDRLADRQKAREEIGAIYAHGEQPDGTIDMDYQQKYTQDAENNWNLNHPNTP